MNSEKYAQSLYYLLAVNNSISLVYADYEIVWLPEWKIFELRKEGQQKQLGGSSSHLQSAMERITAIQDWRIKDNRL